MPVQRKEKVYLISLCLFFNNSFKILFLLLLYLSANCRDFKEIAVPLEIFGVEHVSMSIIEACNVGGLGNDDSLFSSRDLFNFFYLPWQSSFLTEDNISCIESSPTWPWRCTANLFPPTFYTASCPHPCCAKGKNCARIQRC